MDNSIEVLNADLADELIVINSIYGDGTATTTYSDPDHTTVELRLSQDDQDDCTFLVRFPATYPSARPILTGILPLHMTTDPIVNNDVTYFRACIIVRHVPDEVSLYDAISQFLEIQQTRSQLPADQAETLSQRDESRVADLHEKLSILAEAVQDASPASTAIADSLPRVATCSVCLEAVFTTLAARLPHCSHTFCSACLQEGIRNFLTTRSPFRCCGKFVPTNIVGRFGNLDHAAFTQYSTFVDETTGPRPIFCYEPTCATFIPSYRITDKGALCLSCDRITCAACRQKHHTGMCRRDINRLKNVAKKSGWKFCPSCEQLVERISGCKSMKCLCGTVFCYHCGQEAPDGRHAGGCCLNGAFFDTMVLRQRQ